MGREKKQKKSAKKATLKREVAISQTAANLVRHLTSQIQTKNDERMRVLIVAAAERGIDMTNYDYDMKLGRFILKK